MKKVKMKTNLPLAEIIKLKNKQRAKTNAWFFKTGEGEYGEGDEFLGVTVPDVRRVARKYKNSSTLDIQGLLESKFHEARLLGLFILVGQFERSENAGQEVIVHFYVKNIARVNNWDLVDSSAHKILGAYLFDKDRRMLYQLASSKDLWKRRIAIVSTWYFIKNGDIQETFKISEILMDDKRDLIHKAIGWMLREVGKVDEQAMIDFLRRNKKILPRTALRYAIERLSDRLKKDLMK